jgi:hypothetical protein
VTGKVKQSKEAWKEEVPYDSHHKHWIGYFDKVCPAMLTGLSLKYILTGNTMPLRDTSSTKYILKTLSDNEQHLCRHLRYCLSQDDKG